MTVLLSRRGVLRCLTGLIAAPAIVRADALMRIVSVPSGLYAGDIFDPIADLEARLGALKYERNLWFTRWGEMAELFKPESPYRLRLLPAPAEHRAKG